ncbi:hypothetical protein [Lucifera butyrica]|uniref:hypothetical protein n=1 Tax=Lucifera butyrica TaxID=1351585 RepID=UPI001A9DE836|nr:hypothetical protein [Lucifera butyrica]
MQQFQDNEKIPAAGLFLGRERSRQQCHRCYGSWCGNDAKASIEPPVWAAIFALFFIHNLVILKVKEGESR